jgi:hypothetical protein
MDLNNKILLEQIVWELISCSKKSNWSNCNQKVEDGKCYVDKASCKSKPAPPKPKPKPKETDEKPKETDEKNITYCKWKVSDGMPFTCNNIEECDTESGNIFRDYVNTQFPEIAKKYTLDKKGTKTLDYCNDTMKKVWNHVYDSNEFLGLKGHTIGDIYSNDLKPRGFVIDCDPWKTDNYFIKDYTTDNERDDAAFKMVVSFNDKYDSILDVGMMDVCDPTIDNNLGWAETQKTGLHKHPLVKWIADSDLEGIKFYDMWKETLKESVTTHLIERKLKIKKKLKEMKTNKTISENVKEKLKISKLDKKISLKENSKYFFNQSYRKFFNNYFNSGVLKTLNESELGDFDIAFNSVFGGHEETFIDKAIQYILNKLQIDSNTPIGKKITDTFKSLPKEEAKKMIDPQYVSDTIVSILPESFIEISDPSGDGLETIIRNTIAKLAASRTTLDDLTHQISQKVKQSLEDLKTTTIETSSDMKKSYIDKLKSSITQGL